MALYLVMQVISGRKPVVVWVEVADVVALVVCDVVGDVTRHAPNVPAANEVAMAFSVPTAAEQLDGSNRNRPNAHSIVSAATSGSPAGPRKLRSAPFSSAAVSAHDPPSATNRSSPFNDSHPSFPPPPPQEAITRFSRSACPVHAWPGLT